MKIERVGHGIVVLHVNIHITCGYTGGFIFGYYSQTCEVYSPSDDKSFVTQPINLTRSFHGCCAHKGTAYVCGGKNVEASTCCEKHESKEGEWRFVASMNVGRECFVVVLCGNHIWAFCGRNVEG